MIIIRLCPYSPANKAPECNRVLQSARNMDKFFLAGIFPVQKIIFLCFAVHLGHTQSVNFCLFGIQLLFFLLVPISPYSFLISCGLCGPDVSQSIKGYKN